MPDVHQRPTALWDAHDRAWARHFPCRRERVDRTISARRTLFAPQASYEVSTCVIRGRSFFRSSSINATGNPAVGVSINSKAGLDLDAAFTLNTSNNGDGLLVQQNSVMTVFNTPQFSGAQGFSTVNANNNTRTGVRVLTDAVLTLVNQARIISNHNGTTGFVADNGSGVTLVNSTVSGNTAVDIQLTFGASADVRTTTFGTYTCDATVLVRGNSTIVCPH